MNLHYPFFVLDQTKQLPRGGAFKEAQSQTSLENKNKSIECEIMIARFGEDLFGLFQYACHFSQKLTLNNSGPI